MPQIQWPWAFLLLDYPVLQNPLPKIFLRAPGSHAYTNISLRPSGQTMHTTPIYIYGSSEICSYKTIITKNPTKVLNVITYSCQPQHRDFLFCSGRRNSGGDSKMFSLFCFFSPSKMSQRCPNVPIHEKYLHTYIHTNTHTHTYSQSTYIDTLPSPSYKPSTGVQTLEQLS